MRQAFQFAVAVSTDFVLTVANVAVSTDFVLTVANTHSWALNQNLTVLNVNC
jgi:hypothetical protein